ncbi:hypothetical protein ACM25N_11270 [Roseovarius sp. C7]|uniref:hypothetical protein n=1 Tax=Roseovarius sp. C7 TaxID=3398643 RepID=UPI0039F6EADD
MKHFPILISLLLSASAALAQQNSPTKADILAATTSQAKERRGGQFDIEVVGDVVRTTDRRGESPVSETRLTDKIFCEPFLSRGVEHWNCTYMGEWRRGAIVNGGDAAARNAATIDALQSKPWRQRRAETVLIAAQGQFSVATDYVQQLENGYVKIFDGVENCIQIKPGETGPEGSFLPCGQSEVYEFNGQQNLRPLPRSGAG